MSSQTSTTDTITDQINNEPLKLQQYRLLRKETKEHLKLREPKHLGCMENGVRRILLM